MPDQPAPVTPVLTTREERKQLLVFLCAADRVAWTRSLRPRRPGGPVAKWTRELIGYLETLGGFLPGRLGRYLRGAGFFTQIARQFGWLRF